MTALLECESRWDGRAAWRAQRPTPSWAWSGAPWRASNTTPHRFAKYFVRRMRCYSTHRSQQTCKGSKIETLGFEHDGTVAGVGGVAASVAGAGSAGAGGGGGATSDPLVAMWRDPGP